MKRHWIEYGEQWTPGPMSYWGHRETDGKPWSEAKLFDPPKPSPAGGRGFARYFVEVEGVVFYFASLDELRVCIAMLEHRVLPSTLKETAARGVRKFGIGPNRHWLSRLPARVLVWRRRARVVNYLRRSLGTFGEHGKV